ncbi:TPA: YnaM/YnfT family protein [Enterobacter ludwigii]
MTAFIITSTVAVVLGLMILSLIKVGISTSNNPDNF